MRPIIVSDRQNIVDVAIQYYGSAAAVIDLCIDNGLELDTDLTPGMILQIQDTYPDSANADVADYLQGNNVQVVSMSELNTADVLGDNDGDIIVTNEDNYLGV